jgi:hypothetical protein
MNQMLHQPPVMEEPMTASSNLSLSVSNERMSYVSALNSQSWWTESAATDDGDGGRHANGDTNAEGCGSHVMSHASTSAQYGSMACHVHGSAEPDVRNDVYLSSGQIDGMTPLCVYGHFLALEQQPYGNDHNNEHYICNSNINNNSNIINGYNINDNNGYNDYNNNVYNNNYSFSEPLDSTHTFYAPPHLTH